MTHGRQGPGTDPETVEEIRGALRSGAEVTVRILNYKRGGRPFWNMFTLAPMRDSDGTTRFFVGVQVRPGGARGGWVGLVWSAARLAPARLAGAC